MATTSSQYLTATESNDSSLPVVQYTGKVRPVVSVSTRGSVNGQFFNPFGVAVEQTTDYIYVADQTNHQVQVLSRDGVFLFKFGSRKMNSPLCIAFYRDRVFVTQYQGGCLLMYDLDGRFIREIGSKGSKEGQFDNPWGIAVHSSNGDIYICDYSNHRVQVFSNNCSYKSQFGLNILNCPRDVQLTNDTIFVLSFQTPILCTFNYNLSHVRNIVCDCICKHLENPFSFIIDGNDSFIISEHIGNKIVIFDKTGHLLHTVTDSLLHPTGVCLNSNGGIIVAGYSDSLLIF